MINFHKYGFLDTRKLTSILKESNYWLCQYNPIWLFIWSDYYKPEICFTNDFCFIRILIPNVGICYYPPIGNKKLKDGLKQIEEDAKDNGFDLAFYAVDEDMKKKLDSYGYKLYENAYLDSYIYGVDDLSFYKAKEYKDIRKSLKLLEKDKKMVLCRKIKKEDFPDILSFIEKCTNSTRLDDPLYYNRLNMLKKCIDHLYELDMIGIIIYDEAGIYGLAIASILNNVTFVHYIEALDVIGAYEYLLMTMARSVYSKTKFLSLEFDNKNEKLKKKYLKLKPYKLEALYASFDF